jgi:hypothetical protein
MIVVDGKAQCQPPSLNLFTPEVDGLKVRVNGVTMPGCSDVKVTRVHWEWGDGQSGDYWFPASHTYGSGGTYTIEVTSYQSDGQSTTRSVTVSQQPPTKVKVYVYAIDDSNRQHSYNIQDVAKIAGAQIGVEYSGSSQVLTTGSSYPGPYVEVDENSQVTVEFVQNPTGWTFAGHWDVFQISWSDGDSRSFNVGTSDKHVSASFNPVSPETSMVYVYALPLSLLGQDPSGLTGSDIHAPILVNYVLNGEPKSTTDHTPFRLDADVSSEISFSVAAHPSGWEFSHTWDHYGHNQYRQVTDLEIRVPSGTQKITAFFVGQQPVFDFDVFIDPPSQSVKQGDTASYTVRVELRSGSPQDVSLSCLGQIECTLDRSSGMPPFTASLTIPTSSTTPALSYYVKVSASSGATTRSARATIEVTQQGTPPQLSLYQPQIEGLTVTINGDTYAGTPGSTITRLEWDWGDGPPEDRPFPASHTYGAAGTYTVTVTSYQSDGLSTTKSVTVDTVGGATTVDMSGDLKVANLGLTVSPSTLTMEEETTVRVTFQLQGRAGVSLASWLAARLFNFGKITYTYNIAVKKAIPWWWDHEVLKLSFSRTIECSLKCALTSGEYVVTLEDGTKIVTSDVQKAVDILYNLDLTYSVKGSRFWTSIWPWVYEDSGNVHAEVSVSWRSLLGGSGSSPTAWSPEVLVIVRKG